MTAPACLRIFRSTLHTPQQLRPYPLSMAPWAGRIWGQGVRHTTLHSLQQQPGSCSLLHTRP
jgi:hypothetical protein